MIVSAIPYAYKIKELTIEILPKSPIYTCNQRRGTRGLGLSRTQVPEYPFISQLTDFC